MSSLVKTEIPAGDGTGFTYDSNKVEFVSGKARLKLVNKAESDSQGFDSDAGFVYDSDLVEFVGGVMRQKNTADLNEIFRISVYAANPNAIWATVGSKVGASFNGAVVTSHGGNDYLDQSAQVGGQRWSYDGAAVNFGRQGTVRFKVKSVIGGFPAANRWLFHFEGIGGSTNSRLYLYQQSNGTIVGRIYNSSGGFTSVSFGVWNPVAYQEYEFEYDLDLLNGETRLFIDGVQSGSTLNNVIVRGAVESFATSEAIQQSVFLIRDIQIYDAVQHTANYIPNPDPLILCRASTVIFPVMTYGGLGVIQSVDSVISTGDNPPPNSNSFTDTEIQMQINFDDSIVQQSIDNMVVNYSGQGFPLDSPTITTMTGLQMTELVIFDSVFKELGADEVRFCSFFNGVFYYIVGNSYQVSDGTVAQSNTLAEVKAALANAPLDISPDGSVYFVMFLKSADGSTTPNFSSVTSGYLYAVNKECPPTCVVSGVITTDGCTPVVGAKVEFVAEDDYFYGNNLVTKDISVITDDNGAFYISLIETASTERTIDCYISYEENGETKELAPYKGLTVPNTIETTLAAMVAATP